MILNHHKTIKLGRRELTGNPTATLSSAIVFVPARRLTFSVYVNLLYCLVPKAEPIICHLHFIAEWFGNSKNDRSKSWN